jgi:hypothetical protein
MLFAAALEAASDGEEAFQDTNRGVGTFRRCAGSPRDRFVTVDTATGI